MLQGVFNQSQNMAVRKGVVDVFCFPPPFDEPRGVESLEASGNGAQFSNSASSDTQISLVVSVVSS